MKQVLLCLMSFFVLRCAGLQGEEIDYSRRVVSLKKIAVGNNPVAQILLSDGSQWNFTFSCDKTFMQDLKELYPPNTAIFISYIYGKKQGSYTLHALVPRMKDTYRGYPVELTAESQNQLPKIVSIKTGDPEHEIVLTDGSSLVLFKDFTFQNKDLVSWKEGDRVIVSRSTGHKWMIINTDAPPSERTSLIKRRA